MTLSITLTNATHIDTICLCRLAYMQGVEIYDDNLYYATCDNQVYYAECR